MCISIRVYFCESVCVFLYVSVFVYLSVSVSQYLIPAKVQAWPCGWDGLIRDRAPIAPDAFSTRESQPARSEGRESYL